MKNRGLWVGTVVFILAVAVGIFMMQKPTQHGEKVIKIGAILPLTGNLSVIGQEEKDGMLLALEDAKNILPLHHSIKLFFEDFKSDPKIAVSAFRRLTDINKVHFIIASTSSAVNTLLPLVKDDHDLIFFAITTQDSITVYPNVYQIWPNIRNEVAIIQRLLRKSTKPIIFFYPTNELGSYVAKKIENEFNSRIIAKFPHSLDQVDFRDEIVKSLNISTPSQTILLAWSYPKQTLNILKRLDDFGMNFDLTITSIGTDFKPVLNYLNESAQSPVFVAPGYDIGNNKREFDSQFFDEFGYYPNWNVAGAYDNIITIAHIINDCRNDNIEETINCIINLNKTFKISTVSGKIEFSPESHQAKYPLFPVIYDKSEKRISVYEEE